MKITTQDVPQEKPAFTPFDVVIRVETLEDAEVLRCISGKAYAVPELVEKHRGAAGYTVAQHMLKDIRRVLEAKGFDGYRAVN